MSEYRFLAASDGTRLAYIIDDFCDPWKFAETIVLLHPSMGSALRFYAWIPHLAREYRVVRPDVRGHGKSEPGMDRPLTHERLARDVIELLDHLGCDRAHVVGSSSGGMIALQTALHFPQRVESLALYATTAGVHPDRPKKGDWLARVAKHGVRQFLTETMHGRIGDATPEHVRWFLETAEGITPEFLARFVQLLASEYYPERLNEITCPTLMVVPDRDLMVEQDEYEIMRSRLRRCKFVTIAGAAHGMTAQIPDRCAEELIKFLSKQKT